MKTTIVKGGSRPTKEIDWSKPMIVIAKTGAILLTTGKHSKDNFSGIPITEEDIHIWDLYDKSAFTPLTEPITITFENE